MPFPVLHPKADCAGPAYNYNSVQQDDPGTGYNLCTTGALAAGDYEVRAACSLRNINALSCSVEWVRRTVVINRVPMFNVSPTSSANAVLIERVAVSDGDLFRINVDVAAVGTAQFNLMWRRVG